MHRPYIPYPRDLHNIVNFWLKLGTLAEIDVKRTFKNWSRTREQEPPPPGSATDHVRRCPIISTLNQVKSKKNFKMSYKTVGLLNFNVHQPHIP